MINVTRLIVAIFTVGCEILPNCSQDEILKKVDGIDTTVNSVYISIYIFIKSSLLKYNPIQDQNDNYIQYDLTVVPFY